MLGLGLPVVAALPQLRPGSSVLLKLPRDPHQIWRERVILAHRGNGAYLVATPDSEVVEEVLTVPPQLGVKVLGADRITESVGVADADCHMVNEDGEDGFFSSAQLMALLQRAWEIEARAPPTGASVTPPLVTPGRGVWVLAEPHPTMTIGTIVAVPDERRGETRRLVEINGSEIPYLVERLADRAEREDYVRGRIAELRGAQADTDYGIEEVGEDMRTLAITHRAVSGERHCPFDVAVEKMSDAAFPDFPMDGPRTARWLCEAMVKTGGGPIARSVRWAREAEVPSGDRSRHEHAILSRILEYGVTYDMLNVANLASFEVVARRLQLIEEAHVDNPGAPQYISSEHYMGVRERKGGALLAPSLSLHVAGRMRDEAAIAKERRKANESRPESRVLPGPKHPPKPKAGPKGVQDT